MGSAVPVTQGIGHFGTVEVIGGNALAARIPLKWKVLGLHTLVVGLCPGQIVHNSTNSTGYMSPPTSNLYQVTRL